MLPSVDAREQAQVLKCRKFQIMVGRFKGNADPTVVASVPSAQISIQDANLTLVPPSNRMSTFCVVLLARAARSEEPEDFAGLNGEGDIVHRPADGRPDTYS